MPSATASLPPKCCCCIVDEAAQILAWISIALLLIGFGAHYYEPPAKEAFTVTINGEQTVLNKGKEREIRLDDISFWIYPFFIGIYAFIVIGCHLRKAAFFLPYLIVTAIAMIFGLISLIYVAITAPLPGFLMLLLAYAINIWVYWVFYKAYVFIKEEQNGGQNQLPIFYQQPAQNS